jgi:hypothetical protein
MVSISEKKSCAKCTKNGGIAICGGCKQSYCAKHFIKHRVHLSSQMDNLNEKFEVFQQDLSRDHFEQPLLSSIYAWERKAMRKIQEIADKARRDLQEWMDKTKTDVKNSLNQITEEFKSNAKSDNFTEIDIKRWTKQLSELRDLLEKPSTASIVEDKKSLSSIHRIKIIEHQQQSLSRSTLIPSGNDRTSQKPIEERFVSMYGPCKLSSEDLVVTQSSYRAGLSQINGINQYSSGEHSIHFLIEKKGTKNIFFGIHSLSENNSSGSFDSSVHGWWNLDYVIINGESEVGDNNEIIQAGDQITLIIDCDNQQIQLEHHRTKRLVYLPIKLDVCPFPWKILVRLLTSGDCLRLII